MMILIRMMTSDPDVQVAEGRRILPSSKKIHVMIASRECRRDRRTPRGDTSGIPDVGNLGIDHPGLTATPAISCSVSSPGYDSFGKFDDSCGDTPGDGVRQSTLDKTFTPGTVTEGTTTCGFSWNIAGDRVWHTGNTHGFHA
jgi:hypothetical protein